MMDHTALLDKLPSSIYTKEADSNNAKIWNVYSSEANLIENSIAPFYDVDSLSGINLDKMALILGIERSGMNDAEYRNALYNSHLAEIETASLPALYACLDGLKTSGLLTQYKVTELAYAREMEDRICDGNIICDGTQNCDPSVKRPKIVFFCDGSITADGTEPAEPCFIRPASILLEFETGNVHLPEIIIEVRKILIAGIGIYIKANL